jgi:uncharacterized protein
METKFIVRQILMLTLALKSSSLWGQVDSSEINIETFRSLNQAEQIFKTRAKPTIYNPHFFDGPAFPLAQAIKRRQYRHLRRLLAQKAVSVNYVPPGTASGSGLLIFALENRRYRAVKVLLEAGANPNLQTPDGADSPLMVAAQLPIKYLRLLLRYGGNPNDSSRMGKYVGWRTPLSMAAECRSGLKSVKLLIEAGANPEYVTQIHSSALNNAVRSRSLDVVNYLVFEKKVNVTKVYYRTDKGYTTWLTHALREWTFPLDSKEYAFKMKLVNHLKTNGLDYWQTEVPKRFYNNHSLEYLEKY